MNLKHKPRTFFRVCLILIFLLIVGVLMIPNNSVTYADDEIMPEEMAQKIKDLEIITIDNKGYKKDRKDPAKFEHLKHAREYSISCWECHHEYKEVQPNDQQPPQEVKNEPTVQDEGSEKKEKVLPKELTAENLWSPWGKTKKCSECHDPQVKKNDLIKLQAAYHKNCKTCHLEKRIFGNDVLAYKKCTSCHK